MPSVLRIKNPDGTWYEVTALKGDTGITPNLQVGTVTTGNPGTSAEVTITGTPEEPVLNFKIPKGEPGTGGGGTGGITVEKDPTVPDWAKQPSKPTYTASEVGADAAGTASGAVAAHNTSGEAHADMRALIEGLTSRLNALADSDDTTLDQLSEIVAYIKSNKALIDAVTTGKVSTSDIVDNLTTNASGKVLSAAQGVALKALIDAIVIPDKLPNPQPLTINGQSYDGSAKVEVTVTGEGGGANINDTTPSSTTTYSSQKIESELTALNDANAALIEVSKTEPNTENTELWIHPNADEVQIPQIDDSMESVQDTWSSKKIAAEVSNKANEKDLAVVAKSGSYNDLTDKPAIPVDGSYLPVNSDNYTADANRVTTTQITKTDNSTLNLPNEITREKWGVIQFVAENDSAGNGTQMYWPIDSAYAGRMYIRGHNRDGWTKWKRYATTSEIPTVPTTLPNPNKLILTGAVTAEYDGSREVSVEIPAGGGSGSYNLPIASATQLGGVMPVAKTDEMTQSVGVDDAGGLWVAAGGSGEWRLINTVSIPSDSNVNYIEISEDSDGNPFELTEVSIIVNSKTNYGDFAYSQVYVNGNTIGEDRSSNNGTPYLIRIVDFGGIWKPLVSAGSYTSFSVDGYGLLHNNYVHRVKDIPKIKSIRINFTQCELEIWGKG